MGEVDAVEVSCGGQDYKSRRISCSGCGRSSCYPLKLINGGIFSTSGSELLDMSVAGQANMAYAALTYYIFHPDKQSYIEPLRQSFKYKSELYRLNSARSGRTQNACSTNILTEIS